MESRCNDGIPIPCGRRAAPPALLLLFLFTALFIAAGSAGAEEKGAILEESGIRYPYGFDPNTVGEVRGRVFKFSRPERGPVRFRLESKQDTYTVLASPAWFWKDIKADIPEGAEARVRGSKSLGKDGNLYIVAQEVHLIASDRSLVFRSDNGFPLWMGLKPGPTGSGPTGQGPSGIGGGFGTPMRGGGMVGGFRGIGGGHR
ncbi:MAG: OB-fold nucleic acid binding domain-containing protein [Desulfobacteria bacterium]